MELTVANQFAEMFTVSGLLALLTLSVLEIVLGIDNIIFIAIVAGKLPESQREKARIVGLTLAIVTRAALLLVLTWFIGLTKPLFVLFEHGFSVRDLILIAGGLFLIYKATKEIHERFEDEEHLEESVDGSNKAGARFSSIVVQILLLDIIFSIDSVITAVGMANNLVIMMSAIVLSIGVMLLFSKFIVDFIDKHQTLKMLALAFLLLIGVVLVADGCGKHIEKGYIYFAMAFSITVEVLNLRLKKKKKLAVPK